MGVITLPENMVTDQQNGIKASSQHVQDNFDTLLNAVNNKLEKDGSIVPTADLSMGSHKLTNLASPTNSGDATTKGYVDNAITTLSALCVKLSGDQTVDGNKTFSNTITGSISGNAGTVTNGVYTTGNQTIGGTKTFSSAAYGTASDDNNSVVTTVAKSKAQNGYFKFGNGLIVQWGFTGTDALPTVHTVTMPISFTNATSYSVVANSYITGYSTGGYTVGISEQLANSFKWYGPAAGNNVSNNIFWIAIGY